jgi:hypothetical protein
VGPLPKAPAQQYGQQGGGHAAGQTQPRKATGGLGAEFRRQVAAGPVEAPQRTSALDQWHVAINDVPVGPIRREELARKIQSGAVSGDSLSWREGFDDWRPLRDIPELAQLLRRTAPPAAPRVPSRTPAVPPTRGSAPMGSARPAGGRRTASSTGVASRPESVRPAARSNVVPIGGRIGATAPAFDEAPSDLLDDDLAEPTRIASDLSFGPDGELLPPDQQPTLAGGAASPGSDAGGGQVSLSDAFGPGGAPMIYDERPRRRQPWPVGAWIAVVGAASFGIALAVMVGIQMFRGDGQQVAQTPTAPQTVTPNPDPPEVTGVGAVVPTAPVPEVEPPPAPEEEDPQPANTGGGQRTKRPTSAQPPPTKTGTTGGMTAEQRRLMEQFGDGLDRPIGIGGVRPPGEENTGPRRAALDENAIRTVVNRNRRQLQSCYELAIRGRSDPPTVRINVTVAIGASGTVTRVGAAAGANDIGGLSGCIERNVRRWRFPASNEATETGFPVVFQPGASN